MPRSHIGCVIALLVVAAPFAAAEDAKPAAPAAAKDAKPAPKVATTEEAKAAIAKFKEDFKAKDVDAKLDAMDTLAKVNHPDVVDELAKLLTHRNAEVKTVAAQDLGWQRALPAVAGKRLVQVLETPKADWTLVTDAIDSMEMLGWRGSLPHLLKLLKHENSAITRWALAAIGDMKDVRALDPVLDLMKELKIDEGAKWEGGEVRVDTGAAGTADAEAAKAAYESKYGGNARKGRASAKKSRSLGEILFLVVKDLTGESFASAKDARTWADAHKAELDARRKALDEEQKRQEADGAAAIAAAKAGK
jgi:HEAT repeat protein